MKKFNVTIAASTREINANEYSVSPKTGQFEASVMGSPAPAWTTSGKGKSAINNHYIYFKEGGTLYYFKSNAIEVVEARKGMAVTAPGVTPEPEQAEPEVAEQADIEGEEQAVTTEPRVLIVEQPKARRQRARK